MTSQKEFTKSIAVGNHLENRDSGIIPKNSDCHRKIFQNQMFVFDCGCVSTSLHHYFSIITRLLFFLLTIKNIFCSNFINYWRFWVNEPCIIADPIILDIELPTREFCFNFLSDFHVFLCSLKGIPCGYISISCSEEQLLQMINLQQLHKKIEIFIQIVFKTSAYSVSNQSQCWVIFKTNYNLMILLDVEEKSLF